MYKGKEREGRSPSLIMKLKLHYRLLLVVVVFISSLYFLHRYISSWHVDSTTDLNPNMNTKVAGMHTPLLEFFDVEDPIDIVWYRPSSSEDLKTREKQMISADVDSEESLKVWLDAVRKLNKVGLKVHFKNLQVMEPCLHHLYDVSNSIHFPVIVHGNIGLGNTEDTNIAQNDVFDVQFFFFKLKTSFPNIRFSMGHVPASVNDLVQLKYVETLHQHLQYFSQSAFITVCASLIRHSWRPLRWLLQQTDNLSLIITSGTKENKLCSNMSNFDLLYIRNDWYKDRVYFDIPDVDLMHFRSTSVTAGSPLHYFNVADAAEITWAHRVNSKKRLKEVLKGTVMFLEADIILQTTADNTVTPIMAHPPEVTSDLTFQEWLDTVIKSGRGMKLDFKSMEAVEPALKILAQKHKNIGIKQPVWLNADVLLGPNSEHKFLNASQFLSKVNNIFPEAVISPGWVTRWKAGENKGYTRDMVEEMNHIAIHLQQPVTFPVRASLVRKSWDHFDWLLRQSRAYTLTIWTKWPLTDSEAVSKEDMLFIQNNTEPSRVYFDLPTELMPI